jgi:hypothetical protein
MTSGITDGVTSETYRPDEGDRPVALGLLAGAVTVFGGDLLIDRRGGLVDASRSAALASCARVGLMPLERMKQK